MSLAAPRSMEEPVQDSASCRTQSGVSVQPQPTEAFEAVVRRAGPAMLAYARRRVDADTAEDVVTEALLVLWRRRTEMSRPDQQDRRADEVAGAIGVTRGCLANARRSSRRHLTWWAGW